MLGLRGTTREKTPSSSSNPSKAGINMMSAKRSLDNGDKIDNEISRFTGQDRLPSPDPVPGKKVNGATNGKALYFGGNRNGTRRSENHTSSIMSFDDQKIIVLRESVGFTRQKFITEFDELEEAHVDTMTIEEFLEYIEHQRLTYMPHKGSHWDKVLRWAEFFAIQISAYATIVEAFVPDVKIAARLIWIASRALLQLGPDNAKALQSAFGVFYRLGLSITLFLSHSSVHFDDGDLRSELGQAFNELLILVRKVSLHYRARAQGHSREESFDFNDAFGPNITSFHRRKNHIIDAMWRYSLGDAASMDFRALRKWLGPRDRSLQKLLRNDDFALDDHNEFTCEWFQSHLLSFSRSKDDTLLITGPAGCGKSTLSRWIVERLQRPLGKKSYVTLSCTIEADVPSEATSLAVVKCLLLQLLWRSVGHQALFARLVGAFQMSLTRDTKRLENVLWDALNIGLDRLHDMNQVMIVVDNLDEVRGAEKAPRISDRLGALAAKYTNVQLVITSRSSSIEPTEGRTCNFAVTPDHTHEDLRLVIDHYLQEIKYFHNLNEHAREHLVEQILHASRGNFLWAQLTTFLLNQSDSDDSLKKGVQTAKETPKSLEELITTVSNIPVFTKPETNLLLSLMLVAERPLTTGEWQCLLQVDIQKKQLIDRKTDIANEVKSNLGPLVLVENGFVRFCHPLIQSHMRRIQEQGKKLQSPKAAQTNLTMRLLSYCNFTLHTSRDTAFESIAKSEVDRIVARHPLLEYAIRSWTLHFRLSTFNRDNSHVELSDDFKAVFPSTTQLPMLEWACWGLESSRIENVETYELALLIRETVFTEKHPCVLQSLIACGYIWREARQTTQAAGCFYRAFVISQQILSKYHTVIAACTTTFLTLTETMIVSTRTELVTRKEEMLIYAIEMYKFQHGKTHDLVIRYYKMLAQLYVEIHEDHKAEIAWRELREIFVMRFGKGSEEEASISERLTIIIKKSGKKTDVVEYEKGIFEIVAELEVWNIRRIQLTMELALSYEARGEFFMAEELYIFLWRKLTEQCHHRGHHHGVDIHIHLLEVVIEYVRFLQRCHRHEEASSILICIWAEYEGYEFESETLFIRLKTIGELMRVVTLLSVAVSVFKRCLAWFTARDIEEHSSSCQVLISETIEEIVTTISTTVTTSSTTITSTEIVIKETFESTLSQTTITSQTIDTCKSLISFYIKLEKWSEAIEITRRSLLLIWKSVIHNSGTIALPREFGAGAVDIAISLAICHHRCKHYHEAEEIYVRIYRACRNSCRIEDERMTKAYSMLISFYEEHHQWSKMIEIYKELLFQYRTHLGSKHSFTIRTLYILGSLCSDHGHGHASEYYEEIITVLNHSSHICHIDALDAMFFMCRYRYEAGHWHELQTICKVLWDTWKGNRYGDEKFTMDFIEVLYFRYYYVLEHHVRCDLSILRQLTIEYRDLCLKIFGATAAITIKAMIELAQICMRSEKHIHEAITIYEEVLKQTQTTTTKTVISVTTITAVRQRLTKAYISICSHESVSTTVIERALKIMLEHYEYLRITVGWAHIETLDVLREVILLHLKLKKQDMHTIIVRILSEATLKIIASEKHSKTLHESGRILGQIYISCGLTDFALEMIEEIRLQIITGSASSHNKHGITIGTSSDKVAFIFLITLEQLVRGELSASYSEVMADYMTESVLYESYTWAAKSSATTIIGHAARLRNFLHNKKRHSQRETLEKESYEIFVKKWTVKARSREIGLLFYISLLVQIGDSTQDVHVGNTACASSVAEVRRLLSKGQFQEAFEVAECALSFIKQMHSYHQLQNVPHGFKLSALIAGRGVERSSMATVEPKLRESMLELSRKIIHEVIQACKDSKIDFVRLQVRELDELVGLLGEQQNFADLEWILELLWKSREVQKNWKSGTIISIGKNFVQARYLNASKDRRSEAIRLCEDICYNLRRVWGSLDPKTLEISNLLSELYTNMGHYREAQGVHENNLRLIVEGDDGDDRTLDTTSSDSAYDQVLRLKQSFLRLKGWDKSIEVYVELINDLKDMPQHKHEKLWRELRLPSEWSPKVPTAPETLGKFFPPETWEIVAHTSVTTEGGKAIQEPPQRGRAMGMKRATSNWGLGLVHRFMHGDHERQHQHQHANKSVVAKPDVVSNGKKKPAVVDDGDDGYESAKEEAHGMMNGTKIAA